MYYEENPYQSVVPLLKYLPLILIAAALIAFLFFLIRRLRKEMPKDYAGGKTISATVFSKRSRQKRDPNTLPYDEEFAYAATRFYYITFETQDCQRLELAVASDTFQRLAEGDTGILTYQGSQYIDFIQRAF